MNPILRALPSPARVSVLLIVALFLIPATLMAQTDPVSEGAYFRERLLPDSVGYLRIPNLWDFFTAPKQNILHEIQSTEGHRQVADGLQQSLSKKLLPLLDPELKPLVALLLQSLDAPLEVQFLPPANLMGQPPNLLISTRLNHSSVEQFNAWLTNLQQMLPVMGITKPADDVGYGMLQVGPFPAYTHFDSGNGRLLLMVGAGITEEVFHQTQSSLPEAGDHAMHQLENKIDASHTGLFFWADVAKIISLLRPNFPPAMVEMGEAWGVTDMREIGLGWGTSEGKGRFTVAIDTPAKGMLDQLIPKIENALTLSASGDPKTVFVFSIPSWQTIETISNITMQLGMRDISQGLQVADQFLMGQLGLPLKAILDAFGPDLVAFQDELGEFLGIKIRDAAAFKQVLDALLAKYQLPLETREIAGRRMQHLAVPATMFQQILAQVAKDVDPRVLELIKTITSHIYWVEEDGYLVFAPVPQLLADRVRMLQRTPIGEWLEKHQKQGAYHSLLSFSSEAEDKPRRIYYRYLAVLSFLADLAGYELDMFQFPSANEVKLPPSGSYGFQLNIGERLLSLSLMFETNPLELFYDHSMAGLAGVGVVAAIAIPNFVSYRSKAACAKTQAEAQNVAMAVMEYFVDAGHSELPNPRDLRGLSPDLADSVELSGTPDQVKITVFARGGKCNKGRRYVLSIPEADGDGWQ